nr:uncharacterized protein LOC117281944 [Nicotiana tomentosiformis]
MDPLKYIFQKPMPTRRLAKWKILLTEFDIVYVTSTTMKAQALADHLAENPVDDEYQPLRTYFSDEEVNSIEVILEDTNAWKKFFDGAVNAKGVGIGSILISPTSQHYPSTARLRFFCTNNTAEYEACIMGMNMAVDLDIEKLLIMGDSDLIIRQAQGEWETRDIKLILYRKHMEDLSKWFKSVEFRYIPRFHNELSDALATLASMLPYQGNIHIDPLEIQIRERHGISRASQWKSEENYQKACQQFFFFSREVLYKRTPDLNLLRCVDAREAEKIMNEVHSGVCGPHMNGYVLAKKILRAATNKNIEKILRKMIQSSRQWHEMLTFALSGYRTTVRTFRATPYLLVYGTEAVIPVEVEIPYLRIIVEDEIEDGEWVKTRLEQLTMIDENWMAAVFHEQLRVLPKGVLYLGDIEGNDPETAFNADAVKRY